jgi:signal transduction histidine kinase
MIKRLKRKYILIVMLAVIAVLGVIITVINLVSYSAVNAQLDEKLAMIVNNEGKMPDFPPPEIPSVDDSEDGGNETDGEEDQPNEDPDGETDIPEDNEQGSPEDGTQTDGEKPEGDLEGEPDTEDDEEEEPEDPRQHMSPETPFETRYFTVKLDTDGTVISIDTSKVVAVNDALAEKYAKQILAKNKNTGYLQTYRYMRSEADGVTVCVFINANRELESVQSFILSSLAISALGILMVFALVVLLSETALKPIIESYEKQKRFITDAGHEMKTPLTVIAANAEIIEMENGDSQWISGIKNQVAKLASLTEKLVILSKMEEGVKLEMNEFSLSEALFDTCEQYRSIAMSEGVTFDLAISENVLMIGNEGEIRRVASLLLDNAFRYVNGGGTVSVRAQKLVSGVEIRFTNSTDGVEKGSLDRWFDRFYRTDLSRNSATGGSGIGLSVVKAIVLAHGGSVKASSSDGVNVEFTINI